MSRPHVAPEQSSGEFAYTKEDFREIARLLYEETGIHLPPNKSTLVYARIAKRLRTLGIESFRDYCTLVGAERGAEEKANMLSALTTNVTRFFREPHHFEHLRTKLLPPLLTQAKHGAKIRIWSAGCSSGQEPYSIALTILQLLPEARSYNIRILATDINPHVIATGQKAIYDAEELEDIPGEIKRTWMEEIEGLDGRRYQFDDAVRKLVVFRPLNLMGAWPMRGPFNAIFCRNVVIYFDEKTQMRIWSRMMPLLEPSGHLYIGHSERVIGPALDSVRLSGTTNYRKIKP
jgi:chemotaxis protein methyltransferase CheR